MCAVNVQLASVGGTGDESDEIEATAAVKSWLAEQHIVCSRTAADIERVGELQHLADLVRVVQTHTCGKWCLGKTGACRYGFKKDAPVTTPTVARHHRHAETAVFVPRRGASDGNVNNFNAALLSVWQGLLTCTS